MPTPKGRGKGVSTPRNELDDLRASHKKLKRDVAALREIVQTRDYRPEYARLEGKEIKALLTNKSRVVGELVKIDKYSLDLRLTKPFSQNGGKPEFRPGKVVTISKGDIAIIGEEDPSDVL